MKYDTHPNKNRKGGKAFLLLLTPDEHEYLERMTKDRGGKMAVMVRDRTFPRGWRRTLDELRIAQGSLAETAQVK